MDSYVNFDEKVEIAISYSEKIYTLLLPYLTQIVLFCKAYIVWFIAYIKVIESRLRYFMEQALILYARLDKLAQDLWNRLDDDKDGTVSLTDAKKSSIKLYHYARNLDYVEEFKVLKNRLYTDAIAYMQQELEQNEELAKEK